MDNCTNDEQHEQNEQEKQLFHVLAVDDSHIDRKLLERLLTVSSYQVTCVDSGDKALEYLGLVDIHEDNEFEGSSPSSLSSSSSSSSSTTISCEPSSPKSEVSKVNLIMTDYSMPGITGYDLLKRIKDSSWKDVPVVVMSSENVPSRINMCLEGGAEEFLLKPVKLSDLRKLHSHLLHAANINPCDENANCKSENANCKVENANNTNKDDSETDKNCTIANKRKATLETSSDLSDRRPRVQELPVS